MMDLPWATNVCETGRFTSPDVNPYGWFVEDLMLPFLKQPLKAMTIFCCSLDRLQTAKLEDGVLVQGKHERFDDFIVDKFE